MILTKMENYGIFMTKGGCFFVLRTQRQSVEAHCRGTADIAAACLPETLRGVGAIALGYAAGPAPEAAPRKENYIVHV